MKIARIAAFGTMMLLVLLALASCVTSSESPAYQASEVKQYVLTQDSRKMNLSVYLPAGYSGSGVRYPVLYLLHGYQGDDRTFFGGGYPTGAMRDVNVSVMVDRLVQEGKVRPLIVACPAMSFDEDVTRYFVPFVDATFRTIPQRGSRAIAGHSYGGYSAVYIALTHPQAFDVAGGFSSLGLSETTFGDMIKSPNLKSNPLLFRLYAGTRDQYGAAEASRDFVKLLSASGLVATYVEDDGDHYEGIAERLSEFIESLSKTLKW